MQQILNITQVRSNLSRLVKDVAKTQSSVVILRDSRPEAVLVPYDKIQKDQAQWKKRWEEMLEEGRKVGKAWTKKNKVNVDKMSEEELYKLVKNA